MTTTCSTWYVENFEVVGVSRMSQVVLSSSVSGAMFLCADLDGRAVCTEKYAPLDYPQPSSGKIV